MASIFEPPPPEPALRDRVWDAVQLAIGIWGLYSLFANYVQRRRK